MKLNKDSFTLRKEITTLIKANIRHKKGSFFSVMILMLIISTALTTVMSVNHNIKNRSSEAMNSVKIGDLVVFISNLSYTSDMISKVKANPNVASVEVIPTLTSEAIINGNKQQSNTLLAKYEPEKHPYKVYTKNEMSFVNHPARLKKGEVYLPISCKKLYDCEIGDEVIFPTADGKEHFKIKGFVEEPFTGAEAITVKLGFMSKEDYDRLFPKKAVNREEIENSKYYLTESDLINIYQKQDSKLKLNELKKSINSDSNLISYGFASMSKEQSKSYTLMFIQFISGVLYAFIILLFVITLIVMGHSISTGIEMDYVNLGVLKSQGFTKEILRKVFVYQYLAAELAGVLLGMLLCIPCIHLLNRLYVPVTGLLASSRISIMTCSFLLVLIMAAGGIFVFIKTKSISEISPVRAISGGRESEYYSSRLNVPVSRHFLTTKLAFRQLTSNMRQYISSGIIVTILVFFMILVTALSSISDEKTVKEMFGSIPYDISIDYAGADDLKKQAEQSIQSITDIKEKFQKVTTLRSYMIDGEEYEAQVFSNPKLFKSILKGRAPLYDNEIIVTELAAENLGKTVGDTVTVKNQNISKKYIISGTFQSVENAGMTFGVSMDAIKRVNPKITTKITYYLLASSDKTGEVVKLLKQKYGDSIEVDDANKTNSFYDVIISSIKMTTYIIYFISILFVLIVTLMVCDRVFLKEQQDYGIYKAFGFTSSNLRLQFAFRFLIVAMFGSILGIIANMLWSNKLMTALLYHVGITNYAADYTISTICIPPILISFCFFIFAYFISGKIKRVDTKDLIVE